jgi:hypothetical protein
MMDFKLENLIGLTEDKARELCGWNGYAMRITSRDGQYKIGTTDVRLDRVNVHIDNGEVTGAKIG